MLGLEDRARADTDRRPDTQYRDQLMQWGTDHEVDALRMAVKHIAHVDWRWQHPPLMQRHHGDRLWFGATPDAMGWDREQGLLVGLELKCPSLRHSQPGRGYDADCVPIRTFTQCYVGMFVTGCRQWYLLAWLPEEQYRWFRIDWRDDVWQMFLEAGEQPFEYLRAGDAVPLGCRRKKPVSGLLRRSGCLMGLMRGKSNGPWSVGEDYDGSGTGSTAGGATGGT